LKRHIAQHLGIHAEARAMREEQILRIFQKLLGRGLRALPVGGGHHHQLVHVLDVPAALTELDRKPVEQFGMRRPLAHDAEVFRRLNEPGSEHFVPHAVHGDARGQRIVRTDGPLRKRQAVMRLAGRQRREIVRRVRFHSLSARGIDAARKDVGVGERRLFPRHKRQVAALGELVQLRVQLRNLALDGFTD
jgi:hypothetical protein